MFCELAKPRARVVKIFCDDKKLFLTTNKASSTRKQLSTQNHESGEVRIRGAPQGRSATARGGVAGFFSRKIPVTAEIFERRRENYL